MNVSKIARHSFEVNILSLIPSQTKDLHEWFYSLPAIIPPSLSVSVSRSLSSSAFLNMHALHFSTTFQIQMDVPCSLSYSPLPSSTTASATPLYLSLTQFSGLIHPVVLRQSAEEQTDRQAARENVRQTQSSINWLASMPLLCPLLCPPTLLQEWTHHSPPPGAKPRYAPLSWRLQTHTLPLLLLSQKPFHNLERGENWRLSLGFTDLLKQGGLLHIHNTTTLRPLLCVTSGREQSWEIHHVRKMEATLGMR